MPFVVAVGAAKLPPLVLDHVMPTPEVLTGLPFPSDSCAVIVTVPPAVTDALLAVTRNRVAMPATVVTGGLVPVRLLPSVAENVYVGPAVVLVVNSIVATPCESVVEVDAENVSPVPLMRRFDRGAAGRARTSCRARVIRLRSCSR